MHRKRNFEVPFRVDKLSSDAASTLHCQRQKSGVTKRENDRIEDWGPINQILFIDLMK
jgi:hypothetical protein